MSTNKGKPWTSEEMDTLLSGFRSKRTDREIAEAHGRTVNAIKFKVLGYACDQVLKEGKTKDEVLLDLGLSEFEFQKELDKRTMPRPVAKAVARVSKAQPALSKAQPTKKVVVVKRNQISYADELAEIWSSINRLQNLVNRYINKVATEAR